eukprot:Gb_10162 [translate_table: standard]
MLRGRESLMRMVGKRRKLESHSLEDDAILSPGPYSENNQARATVYHVASDQTDLDINTKNCTSIKYGDMTVASLSVGEFYEENVVEDDITKIERSNEGVDWVSCPVCGQSIRGADIIINEHLDMCLTRRSRRKLTQRTLLQFSLGLSTKQKDCGNTLTILDKDNKEQDMNWNFAPDTVATVQLSKKGVSSIEKMTAILNKNASNSNSEVQSQEKTTTLETLTRATLDNVTEANCGFEQFSSKNLTDIQSLDTLDRDGLSNNALEVNDSVDTRESKSVTESEKILSAHGETHKLWTVCGNIGKSFDHGGMENVEMTNLVEKEKACVSIDDLTDHSSSLSKVSNMAATSSRLVQNELPQDNTFLNKIGNDLFLGLLETYIVGRQFNDEVKVEQGASILVRRDPQNPKDGNAIKVFYLSSESGSPLGYLPRELAFYLSPLLDNGTLKIEGIITSIPDHAFASVPVKLICQKTLNEPEDPDKEKLLKSAWLKAIHVVEVSKNIPADAPKYQRNFKILIQTVLEHDSHLFTNNEKTFLASFQSLSGDAQRLFIRIYQRKGPWFRTSSLCYPDINDLKSACEELIDLMYIACTVAGYMSSSESVKESSEDVIREMLEVLNVPELRQLCSMVLLKKKSDVGGAKREELLQWLISIATQQKEKCLLGVVGETCALSLLTLVSRIAGLCVNISHLARILLWRVQRLFFLNGEQDLTSFLLVDMGLRKYPNYKCNRTRCVFTNRDDLLSYERALAVAQIMDMALEANDMPKVIRCIEKSSTYLTNQQKDGKLLSVFPESHVMFFSRFSAAWAYTKILTLGVSVLESERRYEEAIELLKNLLSRSFCPRQRGYWTFRLSVDLEHIGHTEESLLVAEKGINDAWIRAGDQLALQRRILRLSKPPRRWKKPAFAKSLGRKIKEVYVRGRRLNSAIGTKNRFYGYDGQQCSVEQLALQYYAREEGGNWQGVHSEGGIWMTFFGLLMWDVLFADVPDVFHTPFQTAPLDLRTDCFYPSRESLIETQLSKIRKGGAEKILAATWEAHIGTYCQGVNWERYSLLDLQTIASCVGGPALAAVCKLLAEDYGSWASGMPDLLLWRTFSDKTDLSCEECGFQLSQREISDDQCCCFSDTAKNLGTLSPRGEAKLAEVKGPRDHLSEQQRAWIFILMDVGLFAEVCKITELPKGN